MITITVEERKIVEDMMAKSKICYVSMIDKDGLPYVIPMNFGFQDDIIYLHSGPDSGSIKAIEENPNVCILFCSGHKLVYQHEDVACSYRARGSSIICRGQVKFENNLEEKVKALDIIMKQYVNRSFTYSQPALENVKIWKIEIESISCKIFGATNPKSRHYKDQDFSQYY